MSIRVLKLKKGTAYQAAVRVDGRRLTKLFDRKGDADKWLRQNLDKRDLGELRIQDLPTLSELSEEWMKLRAARVSPSTVALNKHLFNCLILPKLGHLRIDRLNPSMVEGTLRDIIEKGLSARTANMALAAIQKLYNDANQTFSYRVQNPAIKVQRLKERPRKLEFWTKDETQIFLSNVERLQPRNLPLLRFLLNTGCRVGEAFALQWGDVDLEKGFVCVRRTVDRIHHQGKETTKGNKMRYVGLNSTLLSTLSELANRADIAPDSTSLVFPNKAGGIHHHSDFQRRCFDKCVKLSGVRKIRVHDLRHTFAAHFVMNGGSIYDLKQILGHSDIKMTERYAHLAPDYLRARTGVVNF